MAFPFDFHVTNKFCICLTIEIYCSWAEDSSALLWSLIVIHPTIVVNFHHILDFSATADQNIQQNFTGSKISVSSTNFMFFGPIRKPKWLPWPLICWDLFCLLCNCWTQFNETWQEARLRHFWLFLCIRWTDLNQLYRCFLPSLVFFQLIWRPRWLPWPLIGWYFFSTSLQPLNEWNLTGRKISTFSNKFAFLGPFWKQRCLPWPQIGRDICSTSPLQLLNRIPTKLDRR